jgi:7-carboxy-7-deazaguanine synthase
MDSQKLPVVDIFHSLQGEGKLAGVPSVFVRLAGCPVGCPWCDTKSAWSMHNYPRLAIDDIVEQVTAYNCPYVVVTGGEPLIHRAVGTLIGAFRRDGLHVTLETAGIIYRKFACQLLSLSPKLPGTSGGGQGRFFKPAIIRRLIGQGDDYQLKFVVSSRSDVQEVVDTCERLSFIDRNNIMLMPQAQTLAAYRRAAPKVGRWALRHDVRFSPRLQLVLGIK